MLNEFMFKQKQSDVFLLRGNKDEQEESIKKIFFD